MITNLQLDNKLIVAIINLIGYSIFGTYFSCLAFKLAKKHGLNAWRWAIAGFFLNFWAYLILRSTIKKEHHKHVHS